MGNRVLGKQIGGLTKEAWWGQDWRDWRMWAMNEEYGLFLLGYIAITEMLHEQLFTLDRVESAGQTDMASTSPERL